MKKLILGISFCATIALASCGGHKTDASNVTDTGATSPGISTDSSKMHGDSTTKTTQPGDSVNKAAKPDTAKK